MLEVNKCLLHPITYYSKIRTERNQMGFALRRNFMMVSLRQKFVAAEMKKKISLV